MQKRVIKSPAKINLALNIVGKKKNLHEIESIVSFVNLYDEISIKEIKQKEHQIKFYGPFSKKIKKRNTVSILLDILDNRNLIKGKKYEFRIKKNIPQEAGLGGGSINAASIISFFIKRNLIKINNIEIKKICDLIGSDVKLGIYNSNLVLNSKGNISVFKKKKKINILLVKPNFGCSTKLIYSKVKKYSKSIFNKPKSNIFDLNKLIKFKNDLEPIALNKYSKLMQVKTWLENNTNSKFVRMTGSGSVIVGYYLSNKECELAKKNIKKKFRNYWCMAAKTI